MTKMLDRIEQIQSKIERGRITAKMEQLLSSYKLKA